MLSVEDWCFIDLLGLPYLRGNFEVALAIDAYDRYVWAQDRLYDIKRERFTKRGVPLCDTESVGDHTLESIGLATLHTPYTCNRDTVERMILVHDMPQAIIDNIKCAEQISITDKKKVERLAANVVFEAWPAAQALWEEYDAGKSHEARVAKDIQYIQMLLKVQEYQDAYPDAAPSLFHYWQDLSAAWVSDLGVKLQALLFSDFSRMSANDDSAGGYMNGSKEATS